MPINEVDDYLPTLLMFAPVSFAPFVLLVPTSLASLIKWEYVE